MNLEVRVTVGQVACRILKSMEISVDSNLYKIILTKSRLYTVCKNTVGFFKGPCDVYLTHIIHCRCA